MKKIKLLDQDYEIEKNYKNAYDKEELLELTTDYFLDYDYIAGDYSYGKLRLKGFCDKKNKINNKINSIETFDDYIKNHCAYECGYFLLKKVK